MSAESFPTVYWPVWDADATFQPGEVLPEDARAQAWAVLVFAFYGDRVTLADIQGRGLCIPSGRIEHGESLEDAAVRECYEEVGARLTPERLRLIGWYTLVPRSGERAGQTRICPVFVADVLGFGALPAGSESAGMTLAAVEDVADLYFLWDPLVAAVFAYAESRKDTLFPVGVPVSRLWEGA